MKKKYALLLLLAIISGSLFFISNYNLRGYLRSEITLAKEVKTPVDSIHQYRIASEAPFKYRLLFPSIVKVSHELTNGNTPKGFFLIYTLWSLIFFVTASCAFYWLLLNCGFTASMSFAGSCVFLLLPPMLLAYTLPVHTREDTLAYTLLFFGLVFLIRNQRLPFVLITLLGVLCRETLLILPLMHLFFKSEVSRKERMIIFALPLLLWFSVRAWFGRDTYDMWLGLRWNLDNMEQVIGFLFISFSFCWVPFVARLSTRNVNGENKYAAIGFFHRSAWFALTVIVLTTFVGGIYNEIRLLYLLSPWVIVLAIDFLSERQMRIIAITKHKSYWIFSIASLAFCGIILYVFLHYQERIIVPGKFAVPYHIWIISSVCYIFILLLFLPITLQPSQKKSAQ
jgi:hypothetical protein